MQDWETKYCFTCGPKYLPKSEERCGHCGNPFNNGQKPQNYDASNWDIINAIKSLNINATLKEFKSKIEELTNEKSITSRNNR